MSLLSLLLFSAVYYTLSKQAKVLGANKLHLQINNKLQSLKIPAGIQEQVDISYISSRACPGGFNDPEELLPMCYKCSNYSPHLHGNRCPNCQQEYVFSYVSFEILPLAEFAPEAGISELDAERLLLAPPKSAAYDQQDQFIQEVRTHTGGGVLGLYFNYFSFLFLGHYRHLPVNARP